MRRRKILDLSVRWWVVYFVGFAICMSAIFLGHSTAGALAIWLGIVVMGVALMGLWNEYTEAWVRRDDS
jgi:hypothetical protein